MGQTESKRSDLKRGDHIFSNRKWILYYHHGIFVDNEMVIHLTVAGKAKSSSPLCPKCGHNPSTDSGIVKTCLDCFLDGHKLYIFKYDSPCKSPDEVVATATGFFEGDQNFGKYHFVSHNCEDFASYCKTGRSFCTQLDSFIRAFAVPDSTLML